MKCGFCSSKNVKFVCSQCLIIPYCNQICQENDFKKHATLCLIQGRKRTMEEMTEEERGVAEEFSKILDQYNNTDKTKDADLKSRLKTQLEELYGKMTEKQQGEYFDELPCHNVDDPVQIERPPTTAGLPGLLFVDNISKQDPNWAQNAQTSLYSTTLYLKGTKMPSSYQIEQEKALSEEERTLLLQILEKEETLKRNGWKIEKPDEKYLGSNSIYALIVCLTRKFISVKLLYFLCNQWYPVVSKGSANYVYGSKAIYKFFYLNKDNCDYIDKNSSEKLRNFVTDMIIFGLEQTLSRFGDFTRLSLADMINHQIYFFTNIAFNTFFESFATECNTYQEYFWGVYIHHESKELRDYAKKHEHSKVAKALLELIRKHFDYSVYHTPILFINVGYFVQLRTTDDFSILKNATKELMQQLNEKPLVYHVPQPFNTSVKAIEFLLSEFLMHSFQREWTRDKPDVFLNELTLRVQEKLQVDVKTQMIEIVVNEGTSKDVVNAQLTELVQNSLDAIKLYKPTNDTLNIQLGQTNDNCLVISVTDYVGIDINGMIALSIPFYSEKKDVAGLVGEMGTGFFNVYRSAEVFIETSSDGHVFFIHDTPVRDKQTQRVIDVKRKWYRKQDKSTSNKTTITIKSQIMQPSQLVLALSSARYFVKNVLALIQPIIQLDNATVNKPMRLRKRAIENEDNFFEIYYSTDRSDTFASYVLTKGMPFLPLKRFLAQEMDNSQRSQEMDNFVEEIFGKNNTALLNRMSSNNNKYPVAELLTHKLLENNMVLNFLAGTYTPVQTRSKITLDAKHRVSAWKFMLDYLYEEILSDASINYERADMYFQFYGSKHGIDVDQVMFGNKESSTSIRNFATAYIHPYVGISFISLLKAVYESYKELVTSYPNTYLAQMSSSKLEKMEDLILSDELKVLKSKYRIEFFSNLLRIVYGWLDGKRVRTEQERNKEKEQRKAFIEKKEEITFAQTDKYKVIVKWLEIWIQTYIDFGKVANVFSNDRNNPDIQVTPFGNSSFDVGNNTFHFKIEERDYDKHMEIIDIFSQNTFFVVSNQIHNANDNALFTNFYGPFGTIAHEMEHFRRNSSHSQNHHGNDTINLPEGGYKERTFEQCHADTMKSLLQMNFYNQIWEKVKKDLHFYSFSSFFLLFFLCSSSSSPLCSSSSLSTRLTIFLVIILSGIRVSFIKWTASDSLIKKVCHSSGSPL